MTIRVAVLAAVLGLTICGSALAASPTLVSVGQQDRHPTATFSAAGADDVTVYIATKPDRATDGRFLTENSESLDFLTDAEIANGFWSSESQLDPGTYYVMLNAEDDAYSDTCCEPKTEAQRMHGFSAVMTLTIPAPAVVTPMLSMSAAKRRAKAILKDAFNVHGYGWSLKGTKRLSRTKVRFNRVSWFAGDMYWTGRITIWKAPVPGRFTDWNYSYTIKRTDDYCKSVLHKKHCTKTYRVR